MTVQNNLYFPWEKARIEESLYRGRFDLVVKDGKGNTKSQISLNELFDAEDLAFAKIPLVFKDYNRDGLEDFAVGRPEKGSPETQYVLLSIESNGTLERLPASGYKKDGFAYNWGSDGAFKLHGGDEIGFSVTVATRLQGKYIWKDGTFLLSK